MKIKRVMIQFCVLLKKVVFRKNYYQINTDRSQIILFLFTSNSLHNRSYEACLDLCLYGNYVKTASLPTPPPQNKTHKEEIPLERGCS